MSATLERGVERPLCGPFLDIRERTFGVLIGPGKVAFADQLQQLGGVVEFQLGPSFKVYLRLGDAFHLELTGSDAP